MSEPIVVSERRGPIMEITINRPPANAINREASRAIHAALHAMQEDDRISVGVITGAGERIFSAGWDLKEVANEGFDADLDNDPVAGFGPGGFAGITEYWGLTKPMVAAVNGAAVGGGFEIVLACDVIVMADHAFFSLPEMQRGILPDGGAIQRLPRLIPPNVAKSMMLTGRRMHADEAARWGLVNEVVPSSSLRGKAMETAEAIARGAPLAMQAMKEVLTYVESMPLRQAMSEVKPGGGAALPIYDRMMSSGDAMEGMKAFAEKREPRWQGR